VSYGVVVFFCFGVVCCVVFRCDAVLCVAVSRSVTLRGCVCVVCVVVVYDVSLCVGMCCYGLVCMVVFWCVCLCGIGCCDVLLGVLWCSVLFVCGMLVCHGVRLARCLMVCCLAFCCVGLCFVMVWNTAYGMVLGVDAYVVVLCCGGLWCVAWCCVSLDVVDMCCMLLCWVVVRVIALTCTYMVIPVFDPSLPVYTYSNALVIMTIKRFLFI